MSLRGVTKWYDDTQGWGVVTSPGLDGEVFVFVSYIRMEGYRTLRQDQVVEFDYDEPPGGQDGCRYRATWARPI